LERLAFIFFFELIEMFQLGVKVQILAAWICLLAAAAHEELPLIPSLCFGILFHYIL